MRRRGRQNPYELFDPEFRTAVVLAQAAAKKAGSSQINDHHLIMGLLAEPAGLASRLLVAVDADLPALTADLQDGVGSISPARDRPSLGKDAARAIRAAGRQTSTSDEQITTAHLLIGLTIPFLGWGKKALKRAGVTTQALKRAHRSGATHAVPGLDPAAVDWVWDYLPQSGRLMMAGREAQAAGNLRDAIGSYEEALAEAKDGDLAPGAVGDIYPHLIQANLLAGEYETAIDWLDEADQFVETYEFRPDEIPNAPDTPEFHDFVSGIEEAIAVHLEDLRLQLLKDRAHIYLGQDEFGLVESTARKLIAVADELDHVTGVAAGRHLLGLALAYRGEADEEATRNLRASLEPADLIEPVDIAARTHSLATLALLRGDPAEARRLAAEAGGLYGALGFQRSVIVARLTEAEAIVAAGGALPPGLLGDVATMDPDGKAQLLGWAWRVAAQSQHGSDVTGALSTVAQAISISRENHHQLALVRCLIAQGRILLEAEDHGGARIVLEEALRLSEELGVRFAVDARRELEALEPEHP